MVVYLIWQDLGDCYECGSGRDLVDVYLNEESAKARVKELCDRNDTLFSHYYSEHQVVELPIIYPIKQCCTCEQVFTEANEDKTCPNCKSGNWVFGYIDDPESEE